MTAFSESKVHLVVKVGLKVKTLEIFKNRKAP